jgi:protein-ribulosamine 3-kinase
MTDWNDIQSSIRAAAHSGFEIADAAPVGGGCINQAYRLQGRDGTRFFVKLNDARQLAMFEAEAEGLEAIARCRTIRVPQPVCHGTSGRQGYLVLEYLELGARGNAR